jgi:phospholipid-binding lipoprotein MlaA
VATELGLDHQYEDFGQTLGTWGFGPGAYLVWPLLGPSSVRESLALPLDRAVSPALIINDGAVKWEITTLQIINTRANLLGATRVLDEIALDKYTFIRDAYLQRRRSLVYDGDEPPAREDRQEKQDKPDKQEKPDEPPKGDSADKTDKAPPPAPGDANPPPK